MHTTTIDGVTFIHNGDFSGNIEIVPGFAIQGDRKTTVRVPFSTLKGIVAKYVRDQKITQLEQASDDEVLQTHINGPKISNLARQAMLLLEARRQDPEVKLSGVELLLLTELKETLS